MSAYLEDVTIWLVAEDRVQILRTDSVVTFAVMPVKPSASASADPVARIPNDRVRILAGTRVARDPVAQDWTVLLTFAVTDGGKVAVKVLHQLAVTLGEAEEQARNGRKPAFFVHEPLPRLTVSPLREPVWPISDELPAKDWPLIARRRLMQRLSADCGRQFVRFITRADKPGQKGLMTACLKASNRPTQVTIPRRPVWFPQ